MKQTSKTNNRHKSWFSEICFNQFGDLHWIHGKGFHKSLESITTDSIESFTMDSSSSIVRDENHKTKQTSQETLLRNTLLQFRRHVENKCVSSLKSARQCSTFLLIITQTTLCMWMPITLLCGTVLCHSHWLLTYTHPNCVLMPIAIDISLSRGRMVWIRRRSLTLFGRDQQALSIRISLLSWFGIFFKQILELNRRLDASIRKLWSQNKAIARLSWTRSSTETT